MSTGTLEAPASTVKVTAYGGRDSAHVARVDRMTPRAAFATAGYSVPTDAQVVVNGRPGPRQTEIPHPAGGPVTRHPPPPRVRPGRLPRPPARPGGGHGAAAPPRHRDPHRRGGPGDRARGRSGRRPRSHDRERLTGAAVRQ